VPLIEDERFLLMLDGLVTSLDRAIQEQNFLAAPGLFIPEQIAQFLRTQECSLTLTTNDLELPWELMLTDSNLREQKFVCTERPVARLPMGYVIPRMDFPDPPPRPMYLLVEDAAQAHAVEAIPGDLLDRLPLGEVLVPNPRNRLHDQHP
jgi:hypothetical protein